VLCAVLAVPPAPQGANIDISKIRALRRGGIGQGPDMTEDMGMGYVGMLASMGERVSFSEIDRTIDENSYVLGSNDELMIYIWGSVSEVLTATVDHEGKLIIPAVGIVPVSGMTLADTKKKVMEKVLTTYRDVDITVVLSRIRKFRAYILGEVQKPGAYTVNGATRVSDLIELAGGFIKGDSCRQRAIEIENEARGKRFADMQLFYHNNDLRLNPYLSEGDRVFVRKRTDIVSVSGEVMYPGTYDFMEGDRVATLIEAAGGFTRNGDSTRILLTRFANDRDSLVSFTMNMREAADFSLCKDDRIVVSRLSDYRIHRNVWVTGEVKYPGRYPVRKDKTRLRDAIEMAGGFTDDALLAQSVLFRKRRFLQKDDEFEVLENVPFSSLTPLEKGYIRAKFIGKENVFSIDFKRLYKNNGDIFNVVLMDGDSIVINRRTQAVEVTGAVVMPGLVSYKEGADVRYYISEAGGYNARAKKTQTILIRGSSGVWLRPRDADEVNEGDIILVPEREYKEFFMVARDILVVLSSIAAVITAYIAVSNAMK